MHRLLVIVMALVAVALASAGCSHRTPNTAGAPPFRPPPMPESESGVSTCAFPYTLQAGQIARVLGSCAGMLGGPDLSLTMAVGTVFYVRIVKEPDGNPAFPIPQPSNGGVRLLARRGAVAQYRAAAPGVVDLVAHDTPFCVGIDPKIGSCPVAHLTVTKP